MEFHLESVGGVDLQWILEPFPEGKNLASGEAHTKPPLSTESNFQHMISIFNSGSEKS